MSIYRGKAFECIKAHYGTATAERSGVPKINHIIEGLAILDDLGANDYTREAWCLHPIVQADADLVQYHNVLDFFRPRVATFVMEYRNQANAWLSDKVQMRLPPGCHSADGYREEPVAFGMPTPGPLPEVKQMLIADKVQNYKDFMLYHQGTHERSAELEHYFAVWITALGISPQKMTELMEVARKATA